MIPICGALSRSTKQPCRNMAGKGTDHVGQGRCKYHGGATPIKHGAYSKVARHKLRQLMDEITRRGDVLELHSEAVLLKALLADNLQRYQSRDQALQAWHRATSPAFRALIESNDFAEIKDAVLVIRKSEEIRPAEQPDLEAISMLIDRLGRTVERIHKTGAVCTRDQLIRILDRMGGVVASWVDSETAQKINEAWKNLDVEGR
jgi:hypothetical protein